MIQLVFEIILSSMSSIILIFIGYYFKQNINTNKGNQGFVIPNPKETTESWLYAQIVGPCMAIKFGQVALFINILIGAIFFLFKFPLDNIIVIGNIVGGCFTVALLMNIDCKVKTFLSSELLEQDESVRNEWIKTVNEMINKNQYSEVLEFVERNYRSI